MYCYAISMASNIASKAKFYYEKALKAYKSEKSFDDDEFEVYAQRLTEVLFSNKTSSEESQLRDSVFMNLLHDWVKDKREFSLMDFKAEMKDRYKKRKSWKRYSFVFGAHVKYSNRATFPFKRQFTINGRRFKIISKSVANKYTDGNLRKELTGLYRKKRYDMLWINNVLDSQYIYFFASIYSIDDIVAANKLMSEFNLFSSCASLAQERNTRIFLAKNIKSRKPIQNPHILYWLEADNPFTAVLTVLGSEIEAQESSLSFTSDMKKMKSFKRYLRILNKKKLSPIEKRLKDVILEFDRALSVTEPNLRMLGMWKCIEIASRLSDGTTRKYAEIIDIIRKYHNSEVIEEKAKLVLEARNAYVHQSVGLDYDKRDSYLRWLQDFVNAYISLLMWMHANKIGAKVAEEIDTLLNFYQQSDEDLKLASHLLNARTADKKRYTQARKNLPDN